MNNKYYVVLSDVIDTEQEGMYEADVFHGIFSTWELAIAAIKEYKPIESGNSYITKDIIVTAGEMHKVGRHLDLDPSVFINRQIYYNDGLLEMFRVVEVELDKIVEEEV